MRARDTDQFAQQHYVPGSIIFGMSGTEAPGRRVSGFQLKLVALP
jgi:hypothetical protein